MLRVDFYLLQETLDSNTINQATTINDTKARFACRLIEKAYLHQHKLFVYCNNQQEAKTLDELLWTFKEDSFIPHTLQGEAPNTPSPIQIGYHLKPRGFSDILLNFSDIIPDFLDCFQRIIEIVPNEENAKTISRLHYREYRAKGYILKTHCIN